MSQLQFLPLNSTPGVETTFVGHFDDGTSHSILVPGPGLPFGNSRQRHLFVRKRETERVREREERERERERSTSIEFNNGMAAGASQSLEWLAVLPHVHVHPMAALMRFILCDSHHALPVSLILISFAATYLLPPPLCMWWIVPGLS